MIPFALFLFFSCSSYPSWHLSKTHAAAPIFQSARLAYYSLDPFEQVATELIQSPSGLRMYVNLFSRCFSSTKVTFLIDDDTHDFSAYLMEGEQRLLLSDEACSLFVAALLRNSPVTITTGPYQFTIYPVNFGRKLRQINF